MVEDPVTVCRVNTSHRSIETLAFPVLCFCGSQARGYLLPGCSNDKVTTGYCWTMAPGGDLLQLILDK